MTKRTRPRIRRSTVKKKGPTKVEPSTIESRTRDPLRALHREWRLGKFKGEDTGRPTRRTKISKRRRRSPT